MSRSDRSYDKETLLVYYDSSDVSMQLLKMIAKNISDLVKCVEIKQYKIADARGRQELAKRNITKIPVVIYRKSIYTGVSTMTVLNSCIDRFRYATNSFNLDNVSAYQQMQITTEDDKDDPSDTLTASEIQRRISMFENRRNSKAADPATTVNRNKRATAAVSSFRDDDDFMAKAGGGDNVDMSYIPAPGNELEDFINEEADKNSRKPFQRRPMRRN